MNRGLARRTVFETGADIRYFLSRIARAVRRGEIEVHAYSILTTHYHLLVRSLRGRLPSTMRRVQGEYAQWFNRSRRRDGPLFRGRFRSLPVTTWTYWRAVLQYVDGNAVAARIVTRPIDYPHSSAWHFARQRGPIWLTRLVVERTVCRDLRREHYRPEDYALTWRLPQAPASREVVERRLERREAGDDALDELLKAAPLQVRLWMRDCAQRADGASSSQAISGAGAVQRAIARRRRDRPLWWLGTGQRRRNGWSVLAAGLLHFACRLSFEAIALRLHCSSATARRYVQEHRLRLADDADYAGQAQRALSMALDDQRTAAGVGGRTDAD